MQNSRRDFLVRSIQVGLTAATINTLLPGWAVAQGRKKAKRKDGTLVVIYLRGGCDALNVVFPHKDPNYHALRPGIGIAPKDTGTEKGAIELTKRFGMHPGLEALYPLWESKQFAPIVCVGSPHPSRSHFDCQDFMEYAAPGDRTVKQGWLNRYLAHARTEDDDKVFRAVAMQGLLPRALRGDYPVLAVPNIRNGGDRDPLAAFDEIYGEEAMEGAAAAPGMEKREEEGPKDPVLIAGRNTIDKIRRFREIVAKPVAGEAGVRYPAHPLGERLKQLARVIKSEGALEVAAIDYPGWDHHAREGGSTGKMMQMLTVLSQALAAFAKDLGDRMDSTLVLTMSEFGRTARENGNLGTDHGHGGMMLAMGGPVKGGKVYGKWSGLADSQLNEKRDLPANTDFRDVFHESLQSVFGFKVPKAFFPGYGKAGQLKFLSKL